MYDQKRKFVSSDNVNTAKFSKVKSNPKGFGRKVGYNFNKEQSHRSVDKSI
ncbi:MAG: hypothetical protein MJ222_01990 [Bacilli bacterium]|nr:hypothetical protein [Bacilli bacterium]